MQINNFNEAIAHIDTLNKLINQRNQTIKDLREELQEYKSGTYTIHRKNGVVSGGKDIIITGEKPLCQNKG